MKLIYALSPVMLTVSTILVQPQFALAQSSADVAKIAKKITVLIDNQDSPGSGVIIQRSGNTYTVLTAAHVVRKTSDYNIVTSDGQRYKLNKSNIKPLQGVDLAVVQFDSNQQYATAKLGNSSNSTEGTTAYVAGFPKPTAAVSNSLYTFMDGRIIANASQSLRDGYSLVYSIDTLPGMSGGPILNQKGELIGVHGRGDTTENFNISDVNPNIIIKTGRNLGIPISTFTKQFKTAGLDTPKVAAAPNNAATNKPLADDFYLQSVEKRNKADFQGAIKDLNQAIKINPKYAFAYYRRAEARQNTGEREKAIKDLQKAAELFSEQGNKSDAFRSQGSMRMLKQDYPGAIAAFSQAIKLNPKDTDAYNERGMTRVQSGDLKGALADYNKSLSLQPSDAYAYMGRSFTHLKLQDKISAIADVNQAISIAPNYALPYLILGVIHYNFGDTPKAITTFNKASQLLAAQGNQSYAHGSQALAFQLSNNYPAAINSFTKAIKANPQDAEMYELRGDVYSRNGNIKKALADYAQAIRINPNDASAYTSRASIRLVQQKDSQGALTDLNKALSLDPSQDKAYFFRTIIRIQQKDRQRALADINNAIRYVVSDADKYMYKGIKSALQGNKPEAKNNLQRSANLYQLRGDKASYNEVMKLISMIN
ncbi:cytochrome c biogenesis factor [Rivularia sp. PCC 7116]|uniref:serine protease n=1 Tax=Rivularia sp. PCC 7116 TaxID=373994 RepID=UPI00029F16EC|nr:serine protease [Rivularia sp. PCC 7116]AFY56543.1 cytochrome c biogenesis factor [Rivularia sp. PCC 7116]